MLIDGVKCSLTMSFLPSVSERIGRWTRSLEKFRVSTWTTLRWFITASVPRTVCQTMQSSTSHSTPVRRCLLCLSLSRHIGNESVPIQLAQCWFRRLAIFILSTMKHNAKILMCFSNKIYGSNFIKQHSDTVMIWHQQNADCSFTK